MLAFLLPMLALAAEPTLDEAPRPIDLDLGLAFGRGGGVTAKLHGDFPVALEMTATGGAVGASGAPTTWIAGGHVDALITPVTLRWEDGSVAPYAGFGVTMWSTWTAGESTALRGTRLPIGLELRFAHAPIAIFGEFAYTMPRPTESGGRLGVRWTF